ncbi:HutD family protein [Fusobacterium hominis]|uniref:HutD/Ves family protein n=1 Tax=Fusobacterium hominis TaxID=2764326 RepID=UPI0022E330DE|nr:HutD family protein [Fusobacterium hominis]
MLKKFGIGDYKSTKWSGGITTELYIYPENSSYKDRNFNFRVSMATTEIPNSTFTLLPDIHRYISILEGKIFIEHKDHGHVTLLPHMIHSFEGDWETSAKGKVTDFNLMLKNCQGTLEFIGIQNFETEIENPHILFVFCIEGVVNIGDLTLHPHEIAVAENENITISGENAKLYIGKIFHIK